MNVELSPDGAKFIAEFEGTYLSCYRDPVGIWTIGIGHVGCSPGDRITLEKAYALLQSDADIAEVGIEHYITVPLNQNQQDALVSWVFNCGVGALADSTLRRKLNAGDYASVDDELNRWVNGGGHSLPGLVRRRAAEGVLFNTPFGKPLPKLTDAQKRLVQKSEAYVKSIEDDGPQPDVAERLKVAFRRQVRRTREAKARKTMGTKEEYLDRAERLRREARQVARATRRVNR